MDESKIIERVVLKLPKDIADYFRSAFPHGRRSEFVSRCILDYKHKKEVKDMEHLLRKAGKQRQ